MITPTPQAVAVKFCGILNGWLSPDEWLEINARNKTAEYSGFCATHDFCDPNQAMIDALDAFGIEYDGQDEAQGKLISDSWDMAKASQFNMEVL